MSESLQSTTSYNCELLNVDPALLVQLASEIGGEKSDHERYFDGFKHFEGLQEYVASILLRIINNYKNYGKGGEAA